MDLRRAINAISDVVQNRPRPLREFDQIHMKSGDMVFQSEIVADWAAGKRLAFIGDGDAISVCVAYLQANAVLPFGPAHITVFDFDERTVNAVTRFAEAAGIGNLDARLGPLFAADIRRHRVSRIRGLRHWKWHLDEMYVKINGEMHYLWRAVDHEGEVLESYVTKKRDKRRRRTFRWKVPKPSAALAFLKKALKRHGRAEKIVTDGLKSYPAAMRTLGNLGRREMGQWLNNRAENSHLPFRRRERAMLRFRQMKALQKFASVHATFHNHFNSERHLVSRDIYRKRRSAALVEWKNLAA